MAGIIEKYATNQITIRIAGEISDGKTSYVDYRAVAMISGEKKADMETKDTVLYETGVDPLAQIISKNNAKITLEVNDVDTAISMLATFKKGDNQLDSSKAKALVFVPLTADENAKVLTFPNCYLQPGLGFNPAEGDDPNYVSLEFLAKPDADTGVGNIKVSRFFIRMLDY